LTRRVQVLVSVSFGSVWREEGINVRSRSGVYEHVVPILMKGKGGERTHYGVWVLWI
jgi:hypothetical protein